MKIAWERHGAGPPLLLIQGLGYARWGWEPVVEPLARSFDVILFDNRGIGESDAPPGPYSAAELAADAIQVLDEAGVERAHVVGTSLGGMIAQELALTYPARVNRLVLGTGASPQVTTANFTLTLLVMVVIGGAGTRYGALLGGFLYTLLDQRLGSLAGSSQVQDLPTIIRKPLSEPLFILSTLFILLVFFVPGGLAGLGRRVRLLRRSAGLEGTR